jgi:hypothetical protein
MFVAPEALGLLDGAMAVGEGVAMRADCGFMTMFVLHPGQGIVSPIMSAGASRDCLQWGQTNWMSSVLMASFLTFARRAKPEPKKKAVPSGLRQPMADSRREDTTHIRAMLPASASAKSERRSLPSGDSDSNASCC